jgi:hypothetical protein
LPPPNTKDIQVAGASSGSSGTGLEHTNPVVAKVLQVRDPKDAQNASFPVSFGDSQRRNVEERVIFRAIDGIPERHMVLLGDLERTTFAEWDLVSSVPDRVPTPLIYGY